MHQKSNQSSERTLDSSAKSLLNELLVSLAGRPQDTAMFSKLFVEGRTSTEVQRDMNLSEEQYRQQHLAMMRRFRSGQVSA